MEVKFKYKNGQKVRNIISGVEGVIDMQSLCRGGVQYSVQPKSSDGAATPSAYYVDEGSLEFIEEVIKDKGRNEVEFKYNIGDKVIDKTSGFKGTITRLIYHLNGCVQYNACSVVNSENKTEVEAIYEDEVELVKESVKKPNKTGGASELSGSSIQSARMS